MYDREPKVRVMGRSVLEDGEVFDELAGDGLPVLAPPGKVAEDVKGMPAPVDGSGMVPSGVKRGTVVMVPRPNRSVTVGDSANDDSRRDLQGLGAKKGGRAAARDVMTMAEARLLIYEAREKQLKIEFVADKKGGKSGDRYERYRGFTTVAECDKARSTKMKYRGGGSANVMLAGDLANDVQKGICVVMGADGKKMMKPSAAGVPVGHVVRCSSDVADGLPPLEVSRPRVAAAVAEAAEVPAWVAVAMKQGVMIQTDGMVEPVGIKQAMRLPEWESWKAAIEKEVRGLFMAGVWDEVPRSEVPAGRKVVPSHFLFKISLQNEG